MARAAAGLSPSNPITSTPNGRVEFFTPAAPRPQGEARRAADDTSVADTSTPQPYDETLLSCGFAGLTSLDLHNARARSAEDLRRSREIDEILDEIAEPPLRCEFNLSQRPKIARVSLTQICMKNWLTVAGAARRAKDIEERMPVRLDNYRFFTRTIDPAPFVIDGQVDYEAMHAAELNWRRMFYRRLRVGCWFLILPDGSLELARKPRKNFDDYFYFPGCGRGCGYFSKLELTERGQPHWHDIFSFRSLIPVAVLSALWYHGAIDVDRVRGESYRYLLKYVTKSPRADDPDSTGEAFPDWVLDHGKTIRFCQSSKGFLTPLPRREKTDEERIREEVFPEESRPRSFKTIREKLVYYRTHVRVWGDAPWPVVRRLREGADWGALLVSAAYIQAGGGESSIPNFFRISNFPRHVAAGFLSETENEKENESY